ncbi:glycosyltransferase [Clostridium perfringens]|uniref:glycosyltransferase n=2 Tax=Clostridium perfringens TaxID=1502 RepID=UPI001CCD15DB|nr:glycosyltransferase [Clostridium perfringens]MDB2040420.1 glycosyltransferase [Clostridium perfringens]MDB2051511.1 glycosyltransferase [Clostridium perfringens]MDK0730657.1 glycosyltransferase [Clostridium perfringens]MDM0594461.1 glycosyltransferase [Clostridium perfringens]MDM0597521.1 glycosyltransferase [Clostridium perfringens]
MKCLHVLPMNTLSGAEKLALILCKNMNKYEPIVVCGGEPLKTIFEENGIKSYSINFTKNIFRNANSLKKIIKENNIEIVHAHDNNASINSYLTKRLFRLNFKLISHIHNCYPWLEINSIQKKIDKVFRKRYNHNIACGSLVYDYYIKNTDYVNDKNITILSNAIDICDIKKYVNKNDNLREKFNIPGDKMILGFVGRLSEQKGIIPFIREISFNKEKFKDCKFLLVGSGEQEDKVKNLIKELDLEDLFILTGYQKNIYRFYPIIDILFLPSLYEGLPMVILEAMSFGKSIVSMDVGSINEVIENNENGILVESNNLSEFIEQLDLLKSNNQKIEKFRINSIKTIEKNYDIKIYINKLNSLYDRICKKNG